MITILVVEDDEMVRLLTKAKLSFMRSGRPPTARKRWRFWIMNISTF